MSAYLLCYKFSDVLEELQAGYTAMNTLSLLHGNFFGISKYLLGLLLKTL